MNKSTPVLRCLVRALIFIGLLGIPLVAAAQDPPIWCGPPLPPPTPTPVPTPPPPCQPKDDCKNCSCSPAYAAGGTYVTGAQDLLIKTNGFPLTAARNYRSTQAIDSPTGFGWLSSVISRLYYAVYLYAAPSTYQKVADVTMPDGARLIFSDNGNGTFTPPLGRHDALVSNADGTFDLTIQRTRSKLHFGSNGSLLSQTDDYGNALTYTYDGSGRIQQVADSAGSGRYLNVFWGGDGRISSIQDSSGRQVQYAYNAQGTLSTVTNPLSQVTHYAYVQGRFAPLLTQISDNWNRVVSDITYDTADRVKTFTESGEAYTMAYAYQGNAAVTAKVDSAGNTSVYPFSSAGYVTDRTPPSGGGGTTHTDYYPDGSIQQFIDAVGVKTFYTYTADGNPLTVTKDYQGPSAVRYEYTYDPVFTSRATSIIPKNPNTGAVDSSWQAWEYDYYQIGSPAPGSLHHVYRVHDDGVTLDTLATYVYDTHGRVSRLTNATGGTTDYSYDAQGNLQTVTGASNNDSGLRPTVTYGHDTLGRTTSISDALSHATSYQYDGLDRIISVTLPKPAASSTLTFTTTYTFDNFDSPSGTLFVDGTDPNSKLVRQGYDQYGQLVKAVDPAGRTTTNAYSRGLLISTTDPNGNVTGYAYDTGRRLTAVTFPDNTAEHYSYTADNLLYQKTDRKNQTISNAYDHFKRLVAKTYPGSATITATYVGQALTQVVDTSVSPPETHTFAYDASFRLESQAQGARGTITRTYNPDDTVATMTVQSGPATTYTYYPDGSLDTIQWSPVSGAFKYTYTLTRKYQSLMLPNGQTRTFSYDDQGRLLQLSNLAPGGSNIATFAYGYDLNYTTGQYTMLGQRVALTATVPSQGLSNHLFRYEYDSIYQLNRVTYPNVAPFSGEIDSWTYDAIGNRLTNTVNGVTQNYTYQKLGANPNNWERLTGDGVNAYTYDANGSMATKTGYTMGWDYENRLASIAGGVSASYTYDYRGRRSSKTAGTQTTYLYNGLNLVHEGGASPADYLFGPGIDQPLALSRGGSVYYYEPDALGSIAAITTSSATVQNTYLYDSWGQLRSQTGSLSNPFQYAARELGEAGLNFNRARYYSSSIGRFSSEDPLSTMAERFYADGRVPSPVSFPRYTYAASSPIGNVDPLGFTSCATCTREFEAESAWCQAEAVLGTAFCVDAFFICEAGSLGLATELCVPGFILCKLAVVASLIHCELAADKSYQNCLKCCTKP